MSRTYIPVPIAPKLKRETEAVLADLGFSLNEAVRLFCRRVVRDREIPFDYRIPNEETIAAFQKDLSQAKRYDSLQELMDDIHSEPDDES